MYNGTFSHANPVAGVGEIYRSTVYLPGFHHQPPGLDFTDQFAFRPSGSTTAALVALFHTVRTMLSTNQFVHVYCFDFSKAFDTVIIL